MNSELTSRRHRVIIVGAGFGGLSAAISLRKAPVDVTVIDRHNYHLFQPLLYQVATAGLSPADIASPIRSILSDQANASVVLAKVTGIDVQAKEVITEHRRRFSYDTLVIATGARHAYFDRDDWEEHAPGIKRIDDATTLRRRILLAFERAEAEVDEEERRALLNFVVIGGGPTGVEMAGAIAELGRRALSRDFRHIDPRQARVILIEAGARVLAGFHPDLSETARKSLIDLGVEVRLDTRVTGCDYHGVSLGGERIEARNIIWAAGVMASPAGKWLGAERDRVGRIMVQPDLTVTGVPDVYAIGDTAHALGPEGKPLPGVAPVAKQQGVFVARHIAAKISGKPSSTPFAYRNYGNLATIGRKRAVAEFGRYHISGYPAWVLWSVAHIYFLIGFRNRLAVVMNWGWNYLTFHRGTRLITGHTGSLLDPPAVHDIARVERQNADTLAPPN